MSYDQPEQSSVVEVTSFVRGFHAYKARWDPYVGQVLHLQRETDNPKDVYAVAVIKDVATVVGHVPYNLSFLVYHFLARDVNRAVVEITGKYINRGAGYGLEVPCVFRFHGPEKFTARLSDGIAQLQEQGLV